MKSEYNRGVPSQSKG